MNKIEIIERMIANRKQELKSLDENTITNKFLKDEIKDLEERLEKEKNFLSCDCNCEECKNLPNIFKRQAE